MQMSGDINADCFLTYCYRLVKVKLTIYATEVKEVGSAVHCVQLKAHLGKHPSNRILPSHTQIVWIHNLENY